jgi:leader peptidase (prepilin peptidase)/N-methyltransferase
MIANVIVFIIGSVVGSFLNVCIHRMPKSESVVWPRSHCPKCQKRIPGYDNIPFISFLLLKGRCRFCHGKISLRYPLVEFITASLFLAVFIKYGLKPIFFFYSFMVFGLIVATFIDIQHRIIPDEISIGGMIFGIILSAVRGVYINPLSFHFAPLLSSLKGAIAGGGIIFITGWLFDLVYFKILKKPPINGETESMGGGDVKLMAMIGSFLGFKGAVFTFFIAPFFGALLGVYLLITKKEHTMPYGPFLSLAALFTLFVGSDKILKFLIH